MRKLPSSPPASDFPSDVLKWMKSNANPKMALKLMQICKFFQHHQFPYFVVKVLETETNGSTYISYTGTTFQKIYFDTLTKKLWITEGLWLWGNNPISSLLSKIAVYDFNHLSLCNQIISFKEFKFLNAGGKVIELYLSNIIVKDENDEKIPLEDIIEVIPNINELIMYV